MPQPNKHVEDSRDLLNEYSIRMMIGMFSAVQFVQLYREIRSGRTE
jgi:hypothetical protein